MLRLFERLDALEKENKEMRAVSMALLKFIEAELAMPWRPAAEDLVKKLREQLRIPNV